MSALIQFLQTRRSVKPKAMAEPGPTPAQLETILTIAARVPDHGKYAPWYFVVFSGEHRRAIGLKLEELYLAKYPEATPEQLTHEREKFLRAPVVVAVVSRIREGKNPQWEQILSAGAACYNLCIAANGLGFASNWLTEWYSYSEEFKAYLGIAATDNVAGFIYLGTASETPDDRSRPDMSHIVTHWSPGCSLNTGDSYGQPGAGFPVKGFADAGT